MCVCVFVCHEDPGQHPLLWRKVRVSFHGHGFCAHTLLFLPISRASKTFTDKTKQTDLAKIDLFSQQNRTFTTNKSCCLKYFIIC